MDCIRVIASIVIGFLFVDVLFNFIRARKDKNVIELVYNGVLLTLATILICEVV